MIWEWSCKERQELGDADADINQTNHAIDELRQIQTIQYKGRQFNHEPQL